MVKNSIKANYKLKDVRAAITDNRVMLSNLHSRPKNRDTLDKLGLGSDDVLKELMSLKDSQLHDVDRRAGKAPVDIYKKIISGTTIYIKFYLEEDLVIISFHEDEKG